MPELGTTNVTPVKYDKTGFIECPESEAQYFSVTVYQNARGYGLGWFPSYDFDKAPEHKADSFNYMYKDKARAYAAAGLREKTD